MCLFGPVKNRSLCMQHCGHPPRPRPAAAQVLLALVKRTDKVYNQADRINWFAFN